MKNGMLLSRRQQVKVNLLKTAHAINKVCLAADGLAPPAYLQVQYGGGSFFEIGLQFFRHLLDLGDLQRDSHVLDVGCGIGRMALPLTAFLGAAGRYEGFDIMPDGIEYCSAHITPTFPAFRFQQADVFNAFYHPAGKQKAEAYRFPYPDASFDIVFSTSVFTHLAPPAVAQYLRETARVLKPGGKCLHSCYLLDAEAIAAVAKGVDSPGLRHQLDGFMTSDLKNIEDAIGIPEETFRSLYSAAGLTGLEVHPGRWAPRSGATLWYQDICVSTRPH